MANMSYCRFQNTVNDLRDCYEALGEKDISELSTEELRAAWQLLCMVQDMYFDFLVEGSNTFENIENEIENRRSNNV